MPWLSNRKEKLPFLQWFSPEIGQPYWKETKVWPALPTESHGPYPIGEILGAKERQESIKMKCLLGHCLEVFHLHLFHPTLPYHPFLLQRLLTVNLTLLLPAPILHASSLFLLRHTQESKVPPCCALVQHTARGPSPGVMKSSYWVIGKLFLPYFFLKNRMEWNKKTRKHLSHWIHCIVS